MGDADSHPTPTLGGCPGRRRGRGAFEGLAASDCDGRAQRPTQDQRVLHKVVAFADMVGYEITCEIADDILSHLGAECAA